MLVEVYADLASEVIAQIRTVMEDFVSTKQYKTWLTERFPLPDDPEPEEDPGRSARDPASLERKSSWRFELPDLQDLNEPPVDNRSVVTAGSSTGGLAAGLPVRAQGPAAEISAAGERRGELREFLELGLSTIDFRIR